MRFAFIFGVMPSLLPNRRSGFTLVELLVVVAIISILTSVALPFFAKYKQQAVDADMHAALNSARNAMEAFYVPNSSYVGVTLVDLATNGYRGSPSITLKDPSGAATLTTYVLSVCATGGTVPAFTYDSTVGSDVGGACP